MASIREGRNESEAVRAALVEAGNRRVQRAALAEEVRRLVAPSHRALLVLAQRYSSQSTGRTRAPCPAAVPTTHSC